ncbi:MAG: methyltransferase domain-containing protein [Gammaproteobacteria bacterium]|nr:MAG: methyltransferase domain-containing protein [Gammaproteobacteria bacterium]
MNVKEAVLDCYSEGARAVQPSLCCPVNYDQDLLKLIPQEIIDKDYGCGDPSRYVQEGDTVLDLGSGGGKICYMAAQKVGPNGKVIGVDMNDDMLALARKYQPEMAQKLGSDRVEFHKGHIQDLALSIDAMEDYLAKHPVKTAADLDALLHWQDQFRKQTPMIADNSIDLVVSNCVLNLVSDREKQQLINELYRVLKPGGRVAVSDIVSDEVSPDHLKRDPELWSGCISGAFQEKAFLDAFAEAGFLCVQYDAWDNEPWQVIEGIEFRSVTLTAIKGETSPCLDIGQAVIYKGPYAQVLDDEGHIFPRGERMAVCERTFRFLTEGPLKEDFIGIQPAQPAEPRTFCMPAGTVRPASETKGGSHHGGGKRSGGCC